MNKMLMMIGVTCLSTNVALATQALPALTIDKKEISVSGLSSGGYMAVQLHIAHSGLFRGAGVVAAGPYYCAQGSLISALRTCMTKPEGIDIQKLVAVTRQWAGNREIDPVSNLKNAKVYLYSGTKDTTVKPGVVAALQSFYQAFTQPESIVFKNDIASEHAMVTSGTGKACDAKGKPFINHCNFDLAGAMLSHLHDGLQTPGNSQAAEGSLVEFDQTAFSKGNGLAPTGWAYIPQACKMGSTPCRLHVALHGCQQNALQVGMEFVRHAGYNRWAEVNRMVVLYPQTGKGATNACWDWWGYDSANYAKQSGPQIQAIKAMVNRLMGVSQ